MPKTTNNKTRSYVEVDPVTARKVEDFICLEIHGWCESMERVAPFAADGEDGRSRMNGQFAELCPLIRARDAAIEAGTTGQLLRSVLEEYGPKLVADALVNVPEMNVEGGTLAYYRDLFSAAHRVEELLAA